MSTALANTTGRGQPLVLDLTRPEDMKFLRNALMKGWDIPEKYLQDAPAVLWRIALESDDERAQVAALKTLQAMRDSNLRAVKMAMDVGRDQPSHQGATHNHLHLHGAIETMNAEQLRAYIAQRLGEGSGATIENRDGAKEPD